MAPAVLSQTTQRPPLIEVGTPSTSMKMADLIAQLKKGGHILLIRHERTEVPSVEDDYSKPATDCRVQRNLSAAGFAGAAETRTALRALAIPVERILSSPMCRTTETARQMFVTFEIEPRLMHEMNDQGRTNDVAGADLKAVLDSLRPGDGNIALVTHAGLIHRATGLMLPEGGIAVLRRDENGKLIVLKQIMGSDFGPHAREKLGPVKP
jgi:phosphohistidine phosphatase SixA